MYGTDHTGATLHALVGVVDATLELTGEACNDQKKHVAPPPRTKTSYGSLGSWQTRGRAPN